ncbi:MAG TPA: sigma-54-dependent Fis family transcriptional regulator [Gammaproteobacteria bacterium]|nr:sigma-54-dependent Fis family transcriptional regulator [Gammaproteobacteria bacterium]
MARNKQQAPHALVVDDEPDIRELLEITLSRMDIDTRSAANLAEARALLAEEDFDVCLTDMKLPDGNGIELVRFIQQAYAHIPVAMITAHGNMESAIEALKAGAFDFVSKPVDLNVLRALISTALKLSTESQETQRASPQRLLGSSAAMARTRRTIEKLARSQAPVFIHGESGTGKELVARLIHDSGPRAKNAFVPVNCGAIPTELMESEFFGHRKGSFSGASEDKAGLFQAADGGTLFLDEVADLPLHMQVKLLRAIQEKAVRPVGAQQEVRVDVRILSATHKDLATMVGAGEFRQDLFYRINVIGVEVPSLRERVEDLPELVDHFLDRIATDWGVEKPVLSAAASAALAAYPFPGNVRELENILERAMTLCEDDTIEPADLQLPENATAGDAASAAAQLEPYLDQKEREAILRALEQTRYNKTAAAKLLGITFRALRYRLKKLGIE